MSRTELGTARAGNAQIIQCNGRELSRRYTSRFLRTSRPFARAWRESSGSCWQACDVSSDRVTLFLTLAALSAGTAGILGWIWHSVDTGETVRMLIVGALLSSCCLLLSFLEARAGVDISVDLTTGVITTTQRKWLGSKSVEERAEECELVVRKLTLSGRFGLKRERWIASVEHNFLLTVLCCTRTREEAYRYATELPEPLRNIIRDSDGPPISAPLFV